MIIKNPNFELVKTFDKTPMQTDEFCKDWAIKYYSNHKEYDIKIGNSANAKKKGASFNLSKIDKWLRLMQPIEAEHFSGNKIKFVIDFAGQKLSGEPAVLDWVAIISEDSKRHQGIHLKIFESLRLNDFVESKNIVVEVPAFAADKKYFIAIQVSRPMVMDLFGLSAEIAANAPQKTAQTKERVEFTIPETLYAKNGAPYKKHNSALSQSLNVLNSDMSTNVRKNPVAWLSEMLNVSARLECFETARGILNYMFAKFDNFTDAEWKKISPYLIDAYFATGEKDELLEIFLEHFEKIGKDDRTFSAFSLINYGANQHITNRADESQLTLPSGKINGYLLAQCASEYPELVMRQCQKHSSELEKSPQLYMLLANAYRSQKPKFYLKMWNKFLTHYGQPNITEIDVNAENILASIKWEKTHPMIGQKKVSIIMAGYSCAHTVQYAISSILSQTYQNIEVLFCDDGSPDGTLDLVLNSFNDPRLRVFKSVDNQGTYNIRNGLIAESTGELITFMDCDDLAVPTRIQQQVTEIVETDVGMVLSRWLRVLPQGDVVYFKDHSCLRMCVVSIMMRREVIDVVGAYRTVKCGGDSEFFEKAKAIFGDKMATILDKPLILGLWSEGSMTRSSGIESLDDGYRAPARLSYAELSGRQRVLGEAVIANELFDKTLQQSGIYRASHGVQLVR